MCKKAIELGVVEIGFSEHMDFEPKDWGYGFFNYDSYTSEIERARDFFKGKLIIRKGVEIDYQHCFEDMIADWLKDKKFDFIIGSVHYLNHEFINYYLVANKDVEKMYKTYFNETIYSIKSRLFDVIGHFDIIRRFIGNGLSKLNGIDYYKGIRKTLEEIIENKTYLEINSKGLKEKYRDLMPSKEIIKMYFENGGNLISVGSDAHSKQNIGSGIKEILHFLEKNRNSCKLLFE